MITKIPFMAFVAMASMVNASEPSLLCQLPTNRALQAPEDTKEEYEVMIKNHLTVSKNLRTLIGNQCELKGSSMKEFDSMKQVLVE
jgi:hypothetical protein